jgi:hypothetical protein
MTDQNDALESERVQQRLEIVHEAVDPSLLAAPLGQAVTV